MKRRSCTQIHFLHKMSQQKGVGWDMCAIAGILGLPYTESVIHDMLSTMGHRGPDGNGAAMWPGGCLLHTRLAIIDVEGGQQPMQLQWKGRDYTLIYNGELYNTQELRAQLEVLGHTFSGHSDTEVLLRAYAQWQEHCLSRLNGIFAFAVWEKREKRLFLARDRMGVKPLFYKLHRNGLLFASEIKTILCYPDVERKLDIEGIGELLLLGPGRTPGCGVFQGVRELEPGCCGFYEQGKLRINRYWNLKDRYHTENFEETAECVRWLVTDAIGRQMVSDVPIGTFLSGGLDSSIITALCAKETGEQLPTFSLDFQNNEKYFVPGKFQPNSDNSYIALMQDYLNTNHHWTVLTPEDLLDTLQKATIARDLPGMADVDFSLLCFCREISKEVKVALSGECADEIFGGYPWFRDPQVNPASGFPWAQNTDLRASFLSPGIDWDAGEFVRSRYQDTLRDCDILPETDEKTRKMKQMVYLNYRWFMQTLLDRKDRMSMCSGLEVRVPFCDHRIAEYLYGVPWEYKEYRGAEKGLLRYAMEGLLPHEVLWRKKSPYPKTHDPKYLQLVRGAMEPVLLDRQAPIWQIVNRKTVAELMAANLPQPWYGQLMQVPQTIAYLLQIDFWLQEYGVQIQ